MASISFSGQSNLGDEERAGFTGRPGCAPSFSTGSEDSNSDTKSDSGAEDEDENKKKGLPFAFYLPLLFNPLNISSLHPLKRTTAAPRHSKRRG